MTINHKAVVAKIDKVLPIEGADNIQIAFVLGEQVIVSKEWEVNKVGLLFPAGVQLSEEFCHQNNLFRNSENNKDTTKSGFFEASRRVRSQPFLKVKSDAFFCSLEAIDYCIKGDELNVGDSFDELNGFKLCTKYYSPETLKAMKNKSGVVRKKIETPFFEKHIETAQFRYALDSIKKGDVLSFQAKKHGTSHRQSITKVFNDLPWYKKAINSLFKKDIFPEFSWQHVIGTRNVVLASPDKIGFNGREEWRFDIGEVIRPYLTNGMTVYAEIVGYANGKTIMPNHDVKTLKDKTYTKKYGKEIVYSYGCKEHELKYHIYRITNLNESGENVDLTQLQLEQWCDSRGLSRTLEIHPSYVYDGDKDRLVNIVEQLTERGDLLSEDYEYPDQIGEGIIIRCDDGGLTPKFFKSKSYAFRAMEGIAEVKDPEDAN